MNVKIIVLVLCLELVLSCVALRGSRNRPTQLHSWNEDIHFNSQSCRPEGLSVIKEQVALLAAQYCSTDTLMESWQKIRNRFVDFCMCNLLLPYPHYCFKLS
jgi:hypothetical protein